MSTGKLIKDYRPLMEYLRLLSPESRNQVLPSSKDFDLIRHLVLKKPKKATKIIDELANIKSTLINGEIAVKAVEKAWNLRLDEETAIKEVSRELAGWILEISEGLGLIELDPK